MRDGIQSLSAMLADLADGLEYGTNFGGWQSPVLVDGRLEWE